MTMDFSLPGFGSGEIDPAVNIAVNSNGQIETREYGTVIVRLSDVRKKSSLFPHQIFSLASA